MSSNRRQIEWVRIETLELDATARRAVRDQGLDARNADPQRALALIRRRMAAATVGGLAWGLRLVKKVAQRHAATATAPGAESPIVAPSAFQEPAPHFTVPAGDGRGVALRDPRDHTLILVSYLTEGATLSGSTPALFEEALGKIRDQNAKICGLGPDGSFLQRGRRNT